MGIAIAVREKANCRGNRVWSGSGLENRVISTGYNGVPEGMKNCLEGGCLRCRNPKGRFPPAQVMTVHLCACGTERVAFRRPFWDSVQGATLYTTMQPCFGCAKELLQAHVKQIVYLHEWTPSDVDPEMDSQKKAEYQKVTARLDTRQHCIADPRAEWAVSALRKKS
jgi:dCMP deaminase